MPALNLWVDKAKLRSWTLQPIKLAAVVDAASKGKAYINKLSKNIKQKFVWQDKPSEKPFGLARTIKSTTLLIGSRVWLDREYDCKYTTLLMVIFYEKQTNICDKYGHNQINGMTLLFLRKGDY